MCLVHELEQLVDYGLQELPVGFKETRVLANNIHDVGCDHSLVIFPAFEFGETQQVLDDRDQEPLFCFLV